MVLTCLIIQERVLAITAGLRAVVAEVLIMLLTIPAMGEVVKAAEVTEDTIMEPTGVAVMLWLIPAEAEAVRVFLQVLPMVAVMEQLEQ